ncbi:hypothetical protein L2E82_03080 [Cichorium intybus]|uniref:Uncharacterized protein n=1 Tax=Cichorium intybus TaxID=13427 RepID=A0ACB9H4D1_CICIN|nr:hypothetical protein L2E82_03080 [Cichorium intybus]
MSPPLLRALLPPSRYGWASTLLGLVMWLGNVINLLKGTLTSVPTANISKDKAVLEDVEKDSKERVLDCLACKCKAACSWTTGQVDVVIEVRDDAAPDEEGTVDGRGSNAGDDNVLVGESFGVGPIVKGWISWVLVMELGLVVETFLLAGWRTWGVLPVPVAFTPNWSLGIEVMLWCSTPLPHHPPRVIFFPY